jgi:hypothetical protein
VRGDRLNLEALRAWGLNPRGKRDVTPLEKTRRLIRCIGGIGLGSHGLGPLFHFGASPTVIGPIASHNPSTKSLPMANTARRFLEGLRGDDAEWSHPPAPEV